MAKKQGDETIIPKTTRYLVAHQYPEVNTKKALALMIYRNASSSSQRKVHRIISSVNKYLRQEHSEWHLYISPVYAGRQILGWIVSDNPYDWIIDVIRAKTLLESFGTRIIEELEALGVDKLNDKIKEKLYELKIHNKILAKYLDSFGEDHRKLLSLIPKEELKRRQIKGMRIPGTLVEKIEEN